MTLLARLGPPRAPRPSLGAGALNAAALVWFLVIVIGQWLFLYFIAKDRDDSFARIAMAGGLLALTVPMAIGIFAFSMFSQTMISGAPASLPR